MNALEGFFSARTRHRLKRVSFSGIVDPQAAMNLYIARHNEKPKPFAWTKPAAAIPNAVDGNAAPSE